MEEFVEPFVGKNVSFTFTADFTGTMGVVGVRVQVSVNQRRYKIPAESYPVDLNGSNLAFEWLAVEKD